MKKTILKLKKRDGFSLVEATIALIVMGIVLGGVLKGRELIQQARMNVVMRNVDMYRMAFHLFQETYGALPGDFHLASEQIAPHLRNGNNDGMISGQSLNPQGEAAQAWSHLAAAGLIADVGTLPQFGPARRGQGVPLEKIGGVMTVQYSPHPDMSGHWLVLAQEQGTEATGGVMTPQQAQAICQKMDSRNPLSGRVQARSGQQNHQSACITNGHFNLKEKGPVCVLYFQL